MTVLTGQGLLCAGGYDISGDAGSVSGITGGPSLLDVSNLELLAMRRIAGRFDASFGYNVYLNPLGAHVLHAAYPTTAVPLMLATPGSAAGNIAFMMVGKQVAYNPAFGQDLAASFSVEAQASEGFPLEVGKLVTAGKRTDTGATASGTGIDLGVPAGVDAVTITSSSVANPTVITAAAVHGLQTGDSILIAGHSGSTPSINGGHTVTVINTTTFTIPVDVSVGGTGGTLQRTSRRGWAAQLQVFSITGTSVTVRLQDAPNNTAGQFVDLSSGAFAAKAALGAERIASAAGIVQRYVRFASAGTFNPATFAGAIWAKEG